MTETPYPHPGLTSASPTAFERIGKTPPIAGDLVEEGTILGFCYDVTAHEVAEVGDACDPEFDRAIVVSEAGRNADPRYHSLERRVLGGVRATRRLSDDGPDRVRKATPAQIETFRQLLDEFERRNGWDVGSVFRQVWDDGYDIWLVGGPVRDSLGPLPDAAVNDLDCTGTIPVGALSKLLNGVVTGAQKVTKGGGSAPVVRVVDSSDSEEPLFEYKGLDLRLPGSTDKASDHDFEHDAIARDLTINSLAFDPIHGILLDPTGQGWDDLQTLTLRPCKETGEVDPLQMYLRLLKFVERFRGDNPTLVPAVTEIERREHALLEAVVRGAENPIVLGDKLKSAFYSKKTDPANDPGLSRIVAAAGDLESATATAVAARLVSALEGVSHA